MRGYHSSSDTAIQGHAYEYNGGTTSRMEQSSCCSSLGHVRLLHLAVTHGVSRVSASNWVTSDSSALTLQISASASILCLIAFAIDAGVVGIQKTGHDDTDGLVTLTWGNGVSTRTQRHCAVTYSVDPPFGDIRRSHRPCDLPRLQMETFWLLWLAWLGFSHFLCGNGVRWYYIKCKHGQRLEER